MHDEHLETICSDYQGDPDGLKLSRILVKDLAEAGALAQILNSKLHKIGKFTEEISVILNKLKHEEAKCWVKLESSIIQGRKKRKIKSKVDRADFFPNIIFVDESGRCDSSYLEDPFFCLSGISMDREEIDNYLVNADKLKLKHFGSKNIVFHQPNMMRRDGIFNFQGDKKRQKAFDRDLAELVGKTKFIPFGIIIRKEVLIKDFLETLSDPYLPGDIDIYSLTILLLMERYYHYLSTATELRYGEFVFESIGTKEDTKHQLEFSRYLVTGTQWVSDKAFRYYFKPGLRFHNKKGKGSHPLEIADLFARCLRDWAVNDFKKVPTYWTTFRKKFFKSGDGRAGLYGIKVFPDDDIAQLVEKERAKAKRSSNY